MNKTLLYIVVLMVFSTSAFCQRTGQWKVIPNPGTQNFGSGQQIFISAANSRDIAMITDATIGKFQHEVRVSHDSGTSWKTLFTEPVGPTRWWGIHHPLPSTYLVTGDSDEYLGRFGDNNAYKYFGQFYFSNDSGNTWKKTVIDSNTIVFSGYMQNDLEGAIIVGYMGNVYDSAANQLQDSLLITTDGWKTWKARGLPAGGKACWELVGIGKGSYITYSFYPQKFYVTTNDGASWSVSTPPGKYGINRITALTPQHIIAVGGKYNEADDLASLMYESFDQGMTWTTRLDSALGTLWGFTSISFSEDKLHGVAVGSAIYRTEDGGVTWNFDDLPNGVGLYPEPARDVYYATPNFALGVMTQDLLMRYDGKSTLRAPKLHDHQPGPLPLGPTPISWTPIDGATGYRLQVAGIPLSQTTYDSTVYRTPILDTLVSDTTFLFNAQFASNFYYARVEAVNDTEHSTWNEKASLFYTVSSPGKMLPPVIISPTNGQHFSDSVTLAWTSVEGAEAYEVKCLYHYFAPLKDTVVASTSITMSDFSQSGLYAVQIRSLGEKDSSDWSNGDFIFYIDALGVHEPQTIELTMFPNPVNSELHISYAQLEENSKVVIFDLMGNRLSVPHRWESSEMVFDLRLVPSGMYLLVVEGSERIVRHVRVVH